MNLVYSETYQKWKGVLGWGLLTLVSILAFAWVLPQEVTAFTLAVFILSIVAGLVAIIFLGIAIYTVFAEAYAERYKANGRDDNYHKELRRLHRLRRKYARSLLANKGYVHSSSEAYRNLIQTERQIAEHLEEKYVEPERKPSRY